MLAPPFPGTVYMINLFHSFLIENHVSKQTRPRHKYCNFGKLKDFTAGLFLTFLGNFWYRSNWEKIVILGKNTTILEKNSTIFSKIGKVYLLNWDFLLIGNAPGQ